MAREQTRSKRRDEDDEDDEQPVRKGRGASDDDDDEDEAPKKGKGRADDDDDDISFDDEDAVETGLFASGEAEIVAAELANYKYGDSGVAAPTMLLTFKRGDEPQYEQPYSMGSGWDIRKGKLIAKNGQKGLPKGCNAIRHLVKPFKEACNEAGIEPLRLTPTTLGELVGSKVVVERVIQEERNIQDKGRGDRDRGRAREDRGDKKEKRERSILEIREILEAAWDGESKKAAKPSGKKAAPVEDDEEDEAPAKSTAKADTKAGAPEQDAIEALLAVLEEEADGIKMGEDLEDALETHLKGRKGAGAIVDLASSKKFLQSEQGWAFDGKLVTPAPKKKTRK